MKKHKLLLGSLTLALAFALTACGSSSSSTTEPEPTPTTEATVQPSSEPEVSEETPAEEPVQDTPVEDGAIDGDGESSPYVPPADENDGIVEDENSPAKLIQADFEALMAKDKDFTVEKLAEKLINNTDVIPFAGATMPVEPGFLNGFTEEITGFESGATFGPMIGSIPFVGYVFELSDDADVEEFMASLESKSDLRWNVCTEADERLCSNVDNYVFFIMAPATLEE